MSLNYWNRLCTEFGRGWDHFWYAPSGAHTLSLLRIPAGLLLTYWLCGYSFDLLLWYGPEGLLPREAVRQLNPGMLRWSLLDWAATPAELWAFHAAFLAVAVLFTLGVWTRITSVLALVACLSYAFRGPVLTGPFEPVLSMMLAYLAIGPCGTYYSVDAWRRKASAGAAPSAASRARQPVDSWSCTVATRLMQLHTSGFCLLMGLSQLGGAPWWDGTALWWLIADYQSRLVDLSFLRGFSDLIELGTHAVVLFEFLFSLLMWQPLARPLLWSAAACIWLLLALLTGNVLFFLALFVASGSFLPPARVARWLGPAVDQATEEARGTGMPVAVGGAGG